METVIFWFYIVSFTLCIMSGASLFILSRLTAQIPWLPSFLRIIMAVSVMLIMEGIFFFALRVGIPETSESSGLLQRFYSSALFIIGWILAVTYLSLAWRSINNDLSPLFHILIFILGCLVLLLILSIWFFPNPTLLFIGAYCSGVPIVCSSMVILIRRKAVLAREFGRLPVLWSAVSIISYGFEVAEVAIMRWGPGKFTSLPEAVLSFPLFGLILSITAFLFSSRLIRTIRRAEQENAPSEAQQQAFCRGNGLTKREEEILSLVLLRFTQKEIGEQLCISPRTVERHIYNLYQKSGVSNRFELYDMIRRIPLE